MANLILIHIVYQTGKDAPLGPSCVKASAVTATSAVISWLPSNSNFQVDIFSQYFNIQLHNTCDKYMTSFIRNTKQVDIYEIFSFPVFSC